MTVSEYIILEGLHSLHGYRMVEWYGDKVCDWFLESI